MAMLTTAHGRRRIEGRTRSVVETVRGSRIPILRVVVNRHLGYSGQRTPLRSSPAKLACISQRVVAERLVMTGLEVGDRKGWDARVVAQEGMAVLRGAGPLP